VSAHARISAALACVALSLGGCYVREADPADARARSSGEPVQFTFGTLQGEELSSETTRGRTTALLFVTTYDLPSQAVAQMLRDILATHKPRANGVVVMMEPPRAAELAQVWAKSLRITLPIAMATPSLMAGESDLGRIQGVPTLLVLDRTGRQVARLEGAHTREELAQALARADAR
jgi:hypothetical protein